VNRKAVKWVHSKACDIRAAEARACLFDALQSSVTIKIRFDQLHARENSLQFGIDHLLHSVASGR
jgi:hypothetical protein